jgi:L-lactate dehydrogenase (cytochrome)
MYALESRRELLIFITNKGRLMGQYIDKTLSWEDIPWIKEASGLPVVIKGVQSAADAQKALEYDVAGIFLSNHGGRSLDTAQPTLLTLLELHRICPEIIDSGLEIYIDGGITRGTDILKALCLGATAVGIGRPFLYSLCYGQEGVEHMISILRDELETSLRLVGVTDVERLHPGLVNTRDVDHLVESGEDHGWIKWRPKARL